MSTLFIQQSLFFTIVKYRSRESENSPFPYCLKLYTTQRELILNTILHCVPVDPGPTLAWKVCYAITHTHTHDTNYTAAALRKNLHHKCAAISSHIKGPPAMKTPVRLRAVPPPSKEKVASFLVLLTQDLKVRNQSGKNQHHKNGKFLSF